MGDQERVLRTGASVTPIFRLDKKNELGIKWPVSLTLIFRKVIEKIILETKKGHKSSKHGFMRVKLCSTDLITFYNKMTG